MSNTHSPTPEELANEAELTQAEAYCIAQDFEQVACAASWTLFYSDDNQPVSDLRVLATER